MTSPNEQLEKLVALRADLEQSDGKSATTTENEETATDWRSIYVTTFLGFCTACQFSLYFSSLWPFLQIIDKDIRADFFGFVIAIQSLGQILASPLVGWWSNKIKQIRLPLYTNLVLMIIANLIYVSLEVIPTNRRYWLLLGRFTAGIGSSNISLLKAYTSSATAGKDRSRGIAFVTGGVALGMVIGPAFQLLFVPLDYPGVGLPFGYQLSIYSAPAFVACAINILCALAVRFTFREHYAGLVVGNSGPTVKTKLPSYDRVAITVCYLTRFTQILVNTTVECLSAPIAIVLFAWSKHDVVEYIAISQATMSSLAFFVYFMFIVCHADRFLSFRLFCAVALGALALFYLITFSWPFIPEYVKTFRHDYSNTTDELLGCDLDQYSWCEGLHQVNPLVYYGSYILFVGLGFSTVNICLNTLFSKIIGPRRQGTQQGLLQVSGGIARMVGPVAVSYLFLLYGPRAVWIFVLTVIAFNLVSWFLVYHRLVPLQIPDEHTAYDQLSTEEDVKSRQV